MLISTLIIVPVKQYCYLLYPGCRICAKAMCKDTNLSSREVNMCTISIREFHCIFQGVAYCGVFSEIVALKNCSQTNFPIAILFSLCAMGRDKIACCNVSSISCTVFMEI